MLSGSEIPPQAGTTERSLPPGAATDEQCTELRKWIAAPDTKVRWLDSVARAVMLRLDHEIARADKAEKRLRDFVFSELEHGMPMAEAARVLECTVDEIRAEGKARFMEEHIDAARGM